LKNILYTKDFNQEINEKVNVILTPEFYWIEKLPKVSQKIAKKIVKSFFKELDEKEYNFEVIKIKDMLFGVALPKKLDIKIPKKYINSIKLAQIELFDFDCVKINNNKYLQKIDDILFILPTPKENCKEEIQDIKLSKKNFYQSTNNNILFIALIFAIINISLFLNIISLKKSTSTLYQKTTNYLKSNNLPTTSFELDSIYQNLLAKQKIQNQIKQKLSLITKTPLKKGDYFLKLSFDKKFFIIIKASKSYDPYFKKYFKVKSTYQNNLYKASLQ